MNKSGLDIHTTKGFQDLRSCSVTDLLKLCEDRNSLLRDDDRLIERVVEQLSEYEQVLYDKDVYIKELEDELIQTQNASIYKEESL